MSWTYRPLSEEFKISGLAIGAAAGTVLALSQFFNPLALGVGLGLNALRVAITLETKARSYGPSLLTKNAIAEGRLLTLDEIQDPEQKELYVEFKSQIDLMAKRAGLSRSFDLYFASDKLFPESKELLETKDRMPKEVTDGLEKRIANRRSIYMSVDTIEGFVTTTPELLANMTVDERGAILAHEFSHARLKDSASPQKLSGIAIRSTFKFLFYTTALTALLSATLQPLGLALPETFLAFKAEEGLFRGFVEGVISLSALKFAFSLASNKANRMKESRADRNALYDTGNLTAALGSLRKGQGLAPEQSISVSTKEAIKEREKKLSTPMHLVIKVLTSDVFRSHPGPVKREDDILASWPQVVEVYKKQGRAYTLNPAPQ